MDFHSPTSLQSQGLRSKFQKNLGPGNPLCLCCLSLPEYVTHFTSCLRTLAGAGLLVWIPCWRSKKCLIVLEVLCGHPLFVHFCLFQEVAFFISCTAVLMCSGPFRAALRGVTVVECVDLALQCSRDSSCFLVFVTLLQLAHSSVWL